MTLVNDVHSQLNPTTVARVERPAGLGDVVTAVRRAARDGRAVSIAGARHAMGGQQFGTGTVLLDMTGMDRVLGFDAARGTVEVEAGITWPVLIEHLLAVQAGTDRQWGIVQKQTGADRLTIGGALAANVHGRGLTLAPFVQDVESFVLVDGRGRVRQCDRRTHADLFALAIGGYGLFGVVTSVTLRLAPRRKVVRVVELLDAPYLGSAFADRIREGFLYGDFQFAIEDGDRFLRHGVFSCYRPVPDATPVPAAQHELDPEDWRELIALAHIDKARAFDCYARHYRATDGQVYWSDTHQLSTYLDGYHGPLDRRLGVAHPGTEMISELYVPREALAGFLSDARAACRAHDANVIYGTVRLIEPDEETVLAWARGRWACVVMNLHVDHTPEGVARAAAAFRALVDRALARGGSYYLTYHRWATRPQLLAAHPRIREFLARKRQHDPDDRFQSDWYRHLRTLLEG